MQQRAPQASARVCHGTTLLSQPKGQGKGRRLPISVPSTESERPAAALGDDMCVQIVKKGRYPEEDVELRKGQSTPVCL